MKKKALIIGNIKKVTPIIECLSDRDYALCVINKDEEESRRIVQANNVPVLCGDATVIETLKKCKMKDADVVISMLSTDEDNFIVSFLCKKILNAKKVITILKESKYTEFFYQIGTDSVVCETTSILNAVHQQYFLDKITALLPLHKDPVNIIQIQVYENFPVAGKKLWEIEIPEEVVVCCVLRNEHIILPQGDSLILPGDTLVLIASNRQEITAIRNLTGRSKQK